MTSFTQHKNFRNVITLDEIKDYCVCEMCGEPPMSTEDASMMDIGYCTECQDYTEFIPMSEFEERDKNEK